MIAVLVKSLAHCHDFLVTGEPTCPKWIEHHASRGEQGPRSCRISIWDRQEWRGGAYIFVDEIGDRLSGYGGETWPTAWPELFEAIKSPIEGGVRVTEAGRALLVAAMAGGVS